MRSTVLVGGVVAVLVVGCSSNPSAPETVTQTVSVTPSAAPTFEEPATTPVESPSASPTSSVQAAPAIMPSVICMNLQAAQDLIQANGVFFSRSEDATGQGRMQISDRNWIVVDQRPPAGTVFTEGEAVLSVVQLDEPNPC